MFIRDVSFVMFFVLVGSVSCALSQVQNRKLDRSELNVIINRIDLITIDFYAIKTYALNNAQSAAYGHDYCSENKKLIKKIIKRAQKGEKSGSSDLSQSLSSFPEEVQQKIFVEVKKLRERYCSPNSIETVQQALESIQTFYTEYSKLVIKFLIEWYETLC